MANGTKVSHECNAVIGEVVFAPRDNAREDLDGYYLTFGRSLDDDRSWLYVWDAGDFPRVPRARVLMPQPVPNGLHGNWFPAL
jgi:carotenoid cleavage dioxygenase